MCLTVNMPVKFFSFLNTNSYSNQNNTARKVSLYLFIFFILNRFFISLCLRPCVRKKNKQMMLPDSPQNIVVVRAPSPSIHYIPGSMNGDNIVLPTPNQQQSIQSFSQPVSESWCLTSVKVIKVN